MMNSEPRFLDRLRLSHNGGLLHAGPPFLFMITADADGLSVLRTVTPDGEPFTPVPSRYSGPQAAVLDAARSFSAESLFLSTSAATSDIDLARNPAVMFLLAACDNIVDRNLAPVAVSSSRAVLRVVLDADGPKVSPRLELRVAGESFSPVTLLSSSFALCGPVIYPIADIGLNASRLPLFLEPFDEKEIDGYLSLLFTYFPSLRFSLRDLPMVEALPLKCLPTLHIEKFDMDRSLVLRLDECVPDGDGLISSAGLDFKVCVHADEIERHPLVHADSEAMRSRLSEIFASCLPRRRSPAVYNDGNLFILSEDAASAVLMNVLPLLMNEFRITGLDKIRNYNLRLVSPRLNVGFSSGIDFIGVSAAVDIEGMKYTVSDLLERYRTDSYVTLADGARAVIDPAFIRRIRNVFRGIRADRRGNYRFSVFEASELENLIDAQVQVPESMLRLREFYTGLSCLKAGDAVTDGLAASLRPYQLYGVRWLQYLYDNRLGGCLADDMGLGKTVQAIALLLYASRLHSRNSLVVVPRSLLFNWQDELTRFALGLDFGVYYGNQRDASRDLSHSVVLTTYAIVRNDIDVLKDIDFDTVILDESQNIKNMASQTTAAILTLKSARRFALSGTPVENSLAELYSLFRFLNPGMFGSLEAFNECFGRPIQRDGDAQALDMLRRRIYPFLLRRLKADVLADLPERIDQTIYVEMEPPQRRFYEKLRLSYINRLHDAIARDGIVKSRFVVLKALSELRRAASVPESLSDGAVSSPKIELLADRLVSAVNNGHKVVVFFNFIAGIELLAARLRAAGIGFAVMTGATADRAAVVGRFCDDADCNVLIMTLKTGGVGLNLTVADMVFIVEPWWNKSAEQQAVDRLHRIGQKATVFSFSFITKDTVEEKILELQHRKSEIVDGLLSGDASATKHLTDEDINFLLG